MARSIEVVVVGGGYAGVMAANRLTRRDDVNVTLINPRRCFVERMRLHQLVGGSDDAVVDYSQILAKRIRLLTGTVTRIDAARCSVALASGDEVGYEYLVYAVGSGGADPDVPGAGGFAYPIASLEAACRLRQALDATPATARVTVVGAGVTGIETAAELAELGRSVTLVCGPVLGPYLHARGRRAVLKRLVKLGVTVLQGPNATVTAVRRDAVVLAAGREVASDVTVWAAGFAVPDLALRSGLATDDSGRMLTDETLTCVDDPRIVAAGDSAAPSGVPFRMSAYAAHPLGAHAAETVLGRIAGTSPAPFSLRFFGICVGLGRHFAVLQPASRNDVSNRWSVGGRLVAILVKELGTRGVVRRMAHEARKPGSHKWPEQSSARRSGSTPSSADRNLHDHKMSA